MARLPTPGGDVGNWGTILNGFLQVSLNDDGTILPAALEQAGALVAANNLSDIVSAASARTNLGLGSAATQDASAFDAAGAATTAQSNAEAFAMPKAGGTPFTGPVAPKVVAMAYAATMTPNASQGDTYAVTLTGNATIDAPTNANLDGQIIKFRLTQGTGGGYTITWGAGYDFGAASTPTLTTTAGKFDVVGFEYVAAASVWIYLGSGLGY